MDKKETLIKSNLIHKGKVISYFEDDVTLPNGAASKREYVKHPGGAAVLAIKDGYVILVNQFRYALNEELLEIPAGKLEAGEDPTQAAYRELKEETGLKAKSLKFLGKMYPSVGYTNEIIYLYAANDYEESKQSLDEEEFVDIVKISTEEFERLINTNEIKDAKTIIAYNLYKN